MDLVEIIITSAMVGIVLFGIVAIWQIYDIHMWGQRLMKQGCDPVNTDSGGNADFFDCPDGSRHSYWERK